MRKSGEGARDFNVALAAGFLPLVNLPVVWWLSVRRYRNRPASFSERSEEMLYGRWSSRTLFVALVDTVLALMVASALMMAPKHAADAGSTPHLGHGAAYVEGGKVRPLKSSASSRTPLAAPTCRRAWSEQSWPAILPVGLGIGLILALWLRGRRRGDGARHRWVWVVVPLTLAPVVGGVSAFAVCENWGSWSVRVAMIALLMQSLVLLVVGAIMLRVIKSEFNLLVGRRLSTARACGYGLLFMGAFVTRLFWAVVALSSLVPGMSSHLQNAGLRAVLLGDGEGLSRLLVLLTVVVLVPLGEEVIFRGVVLPGLACGMSGDSALVVSALLFALFHVPSHGLAAVGPGILALIFGWARLRTGGLRAPVILHATNNLLVILVTWLV